MLHSQIRINYPNCPFVVLAKDLNIFKSFEYSIETVDKEKMFTTIFEAQTQSLHGVSPVNDSLNTPTKIINYLYELCESIDPETQSGQLDREQNTSSITDRLFFRIVRQKLKYDKSLLINFHTTAYRDAGGSSLIDKEFDSHILWNIFPIVGNLQAESTSYTMVDLSTFKNDTIVLPNQQNDVTMSRVLDPVTYTKNTETQKIENNIKRIRIANRGFVVRYEETKSNVKKDVFSNIEAPVNMIDVKRDMFTYINDDVGIKKLNGLFRFSPISSGRITLNDTKVKAEKICFVSILFHEAKMHLTFHMLEIM
jgi:hypothetical protein